VSASAELLLALKRIWFASDQMCSKKLKAAEGVLLQIKDIEVELPLALQGFDCDNGSEFLNYHLIRYFIDHPSLSSFTRSVAGRIIFKWIKQNLKI